MKKINPFFIIGTIGMGGTAALNILMAAVVGGEAVSAGFSILYPVFIAFLIIGTIIMSNRKDKLPH